jgi:hypothetical protein
MKFPAALLLCAAALIPQVSLADAPHTQTEVGMMQAVFDFCSKSDPVNDRRFALKSKELLDNLSDRDRDDLRNNVDFKRGYEIMGSLLGKVRKADAAKGCAELFPPHPAQEHSLQHPSHKR